MSHEDKQEIFGEYYPEAAGHPAYNDAMAAWRADVHSMQQQGTLPVVEPEQVVSEDQQVPESASVSSEEPVAVELRGRDGEELPKPAETSSEPQLFDPNAHTAPEVLRHLESAEVDEAERVLKAEEEGKARKGILNHREEILKRSRDRDESPKVSQGE